MSEMVPRELAEALINSDWNGSDIVVDKVPPDFPHEIDIANLTVLGYASGSREHSVTVFTSDKKEADVTNDFREALKRAGFDMPPQVPQSGFGAADLARYQPYTRADRSLLYFSSPRAAGGTLLTVSTMPPIPKERAGMRARMERERQHTPMPLLPDPPGARNRGGGSGSGGSFSHIHAELTPQLQLEPAAGHYNEQLERLGWENLASDIGESEAFLCYKFTDERGGKWCGTLTLTARPTENCMYVAFVLSDLRAELSGGGSSVDLMASF